jgi:hypothetical protein
VVQAHLGDLPADQQAGETVSDSTGEGRNGQESQPGRARGRRMAWIEARQLAFAEA